MSARQRIPAFKDTQEYAGMTTRPVDARSWRAFAACAGHENPDVFFIRPTAADYVRHLPELRALCRACPVQEECLEAALDEEEVTPGVYGFRGGLDERGRRVLHGQRRSRPAPGRWRRL